MKQAAVQKTIYSLPVLAELCRAANRRYLQFLSLREDPSDGLAKMRKIAEPAREGSRHDRGFNLLAADDQELFCTLARGEHHLSGFTNKSLRQALRHKTSSQISRQLNRLRTHGRTHQKSRTHLQRLPDETRTSGHPRRRQTARNPPRPHVRPNRRGMRSSSCQKCARFQS